VYTLDHERRWSKAGYGDHTREKVGHIQSLVILYHHHDYRSTAGPQVPVVVDGRTFDLSTPSHVIRLRNKPKEATVSNRTETTPHNNSMV